MKNGFRPPKRRAERNGIQDVPGRSFDYFDMLADTLGGLAYVGIFLLLDAHWKRRKRVAMLPDGLG